MKTKLYNEQEEDYYFFGKIKCKLIGGLREKKNSFFFPDFMSSHQEAFMQTLHRV